MLHHTAFLLTAFAGYASAFLTLHQSIPLRQQIEQLKTEAMEKGSSFTKDFNPEIGKRSSFDASTQLISNSGANAYIAPDFAAGDQRGPCPGLNSLANHGYLPRNGVAGLQESIDATMNVFGMALDLGTFLAVYGTVFDGNPLSLDPGYSIGGAPPSGVASDLLSSLGLLGTPEGLTGSHNKYESDASATMGDLYVFGNNDEVQVPFFQSFHDSLIEGIPASQQYTQLAEHHISRFDNSVSTNPRFFHARFAGVLVTPAGWSFPCQLMANHSEEFPDGMLSREVLQSFFGVTGESGQFQYQRGQERIPDNWYRRPANDFSIPTFLADVLEHGAQYPQLLSIGGNTGKVNTFTPIDLGNLTGGLYNAQNLLQGNNLLCSTLQFIQAEQPDILGNTFTDPQQAGLPLTDLISDMIAQYACPQLQEFNTALYDGYPGYNAQQGGY